ncbi:phosphoribosylglycinamide formyltransferase [Sphingobium sp. B12D2B]|uniref:phosphoribosylglycinamide formyltransferase n=1 Tax=Sphingobium sp. B12D2B TaxID=2940577 RepID=UPI0022257129|nr:phosphoribosylglycinamide formyltransferase [Sphingobium sp. B12D2B]MCW2350636.1 phosphoribosylglycinamide formyltransferase-1 [Sphingobium sp. B12D2B]
MSKAKVAVMLSGTGTTMTSLLYASRLPDCPYEIVLVASNKPEARGLTVAAAEGVATFAHSHKGMSREAHEAIMLDALRASGADYVALCGYMRILTADFVGQWAGRMLNTHPSLLPKFKGLDTHQRAIDAGDSHGGCTVHLVTPALDDGPVLGQIPVAILPEDSADTLAQRVLYAEYQLYPRMLASYVGREMEPDWLIGQVGQLALALPETHARDSHGAAGWRVGSETSGKFFAYVSVRHHGEDAVALLVKTSGADEMAALIEADPDIYYRPAYYGASGWIAIRLDRPGIDWEHVRGWLEKSWRAVAPKRLTKMLEIAGQF